MLDGRNVVDRARGLVGARFKPQGRDPELGLDCLGVVLHAYRLAPEQAPSYRLRGDHAARLRCALSEQFREVEPGLLRPGDILLLKVASDQVHMAVHCGGSIIHADARIGRVVETPGAIPWPIISVHRQRFKDEN